MLISLHLTNTANLTYVTDLTNDLSMFRGNPIVCFSDMGFLLIDIQTKLSKLSERNTASRMINASKDKATIDVLNERLAQMSQRATYQIFVIIVL